MQLKIDALKQVTARPGTGQRTLVVLAAKDQFPPGLMRGRTRGVNSVH
jgi:hypothetical protein